MTPKPDGQGPCSQKRTSSGSTRRRQVHRRVQGTAPLRHHRVRSLAAYLKARDLKSCFTPSRTSAPSTSTSTPRRCSASCTPVRPRKGVTQDEAYKSFVYLRDDHWNSVFRPATQLP
jgi:hypothetical protein